MVTYRTHINKDLSQKVKIMTEQSTDEWIAPSIILQNVIVDIINLKDKVYFLEIDKIKLEYEVRSLRTQLDIYKDLRKKT